MADDTKDYLIECCADWLPETKKINAPLTLAQARNPHLTQTPGFQFKQWKFCPWCGVRRDKAIRDFRELESARVKGERSGSLKLLAVKSRTA